MKAYSTVLQLLCCVVTYTSMWAASDVAGFRPPAVPLVTCNPYFSVWSFADRLTYDATRHWTGAKQEFHGSVKVDGATWRIMGDAWRDIQPMPQSGLQVLPTRTIYDFEASGVHITLTFLTPMLPSDLDLLSWPVTYLGWKVRSVDGKGHRVSIEYDNTAQLVVNTEDEPVVWQQENEPGLNVLRMGTKAQPVLQKFGDDLRIDWGYLYVAAPRAQSPQSVVANVDGVIGTFAGKGSLPGADTRMPRPPRDHMPAMAMMFDLGEVGPEAIERHIILAYDQTYAIEYFHKPLRPYWRLKRTKMSDLLDEAERNYVSLVKRCETFDADLVNDLTRVGGEKYARLAALSYRQALAAQILVAGPDGEPFFLPKENFSNGCIGTVDVIYPASPILLLLNPQLLEASLAPLFKYAESARWPFPFAPHDLGTYPLANGQVYGGGEKSEADQMPVEESGNMLLMVAAIAKAEGDANFAGKFWPLLTKWAAYLKDKGLDPANQLCTDDFAGHLAHNANLSLKAIEALEAYAELAGMLGKNQEHDLYHKTAQEFAQQWVKMADDGDHYRLAFDRPGTWSQKYNLVWDKVLDFHLFPAQVAQKEIAYYQNKGHFGFPLDNRRDYTKLDWEFWSATLADSPANWEKLISPIYDWANESPSRVPLTDWYWTTDGTQVGFQARSVVGSLYIKMLADGETWKRWASRAQNQ
ncbi:MAG TPA: DUF4965 domain-containing protein [Terriglobia bacterium]|nr:DUF4965 domain-containing protein [Terriglobia bacterium]